MLSGARRTTAAVGKRISSTATKRGFAVSINVFNQSMKTVQRQNAALRASGDDFGYLRDEVARRLVDRLAFVNKEYPVVADIGCANGNMGRLIASRAVQTAQRSPAEKAAETALLERLKGSDAAEVPFVPSEAETQQYMRLFQQFAIPGVREFVQIDYAPAHVAKAHEGVISELAPLVARADADKAAAVAAAGVEGKGSLFGSLFKSLAGGSGGAPPAASGAAVESLALAPARLAAIDTSSASSVDAAAAGSAGGKILCAPFNTPLTVRAADSAGTVVPDAAGADASSCFNVYSASAPLGTVPLKPNSANMITSVLAMHWINDLPGYFKQIYDALAPDGVFIGAMIGGESLRELRSAFAIADLERIGGVMSHVSPLTRSNDIGDLMKATGYTLLTVDLETINVHYPDMFTLIEHIHGMGEQHAPVADVGSPSVSRDAFLAANAAYDHLYRDPSNGLCLATVDVVMMIGWKPHDSQPQPKTRGSAQYKLADSAPPPLPAGVTGAAGSEGFQLGGGIATTSVKPK